MCAVGGHWGRVNQLLLGLGTEVFPGVWSHTEFNPYYFEVVERQGSTNQLNPTAVFTGFFVLAYGTAGEGILQRDEGKWWKC